MEDVTMMNLRDYIQVIKNRWWIIFLITFIAVGIGTGLSYYVVTPQYETKSILLVTKQQTEDMNTLYTDIQTGKELAKDYIVIAQSKMIQALVIEELGLNIQPDILGEKVSIHLQDQGRMLEVIVSDSDSTRAIKIANTYVKIFMEKIHEIMKHDTLKIIEKAEIASVSLSFEPIMVIGASGVVGLFLSVFIIVIIESLENHIRTSKEIEDLFEMEVLGTIPAMKRKNTKNRRRK